MKKVLAIGDLESRQIWKTINPEEYDHIVFLGDLVDPRDESITNAQVITRLEEVIEFKKQNSNVILILGNHDLYYMYLGLPEYRCNPCNRNIQEDLHKIYKENYEIFQTAFQIGRILFSHAGISHMYYISVLEKVLSKVTIEGSLADKINYIASTKDRIALTHVSRYYRGGHQEFGGIYWADQEETRDEPLQGYHQVVGHSRVQDVDSVYINDYTSITYVDCLTSLDKMYELEMLE